MMSNPPIPNVWHLRTVADTAAKSCMICFKPSTAVLITPDKKDFFYICRGHLKDRGFASPLEDPEQKKEEALRLETEKLQLEYREKLAAKKKKEKSTDEDQDNETKDKKDKREGKEQSPDRAKRENTNGAESESTELGQSVQQEAERNVHSENNSRVYSLHRNFYQMRIDRLRKAELAKRNRERLNNPNTFPSVPSQLPS